MDDNNKSQSLFSDDVRHSVGVVEERWNREKLRRRKLMLKIFVPVFSVLIIILGIVTWKCHLLPGAKQAYAEEKKKKQEIEETRQEPTRCFGYEGAAMKMIYVSSTLMPIPEDIDTVMGQVIDNYPSEIYFESWDYKKLPPDIKKLIPNEMNVAFFINGEHHFKFKDEYGNEKEFESITSDQFECDSTMFACIINSEYSKIYKTDVQAIDYSEYFEARERRKQNLKDRQLPKIKLLDGTLPPAENKDADASKKEEDEDEYEELEPEEENTDAKSSVSDGALVLPKMSFEKK